MIYAMVLVFACTLYTEQSCTLAFRRTYPPLMTNETVALGPPFMTIGVYSGSMH
jgi:hypothetical protein